MVNGLIDQSRFSAPGTGKLPYVVFLLPRRCNSGLWDVSTLCVLVTLLGFEGLAIVCLLQGIFFFDSGLDFNFHYYLIHILGQIT